MYIQEENFGVFQEEMMELVEEIEAMSYGPHTAERMTSLRQKVIMLFIRFSEYIVQYISAMDIWSNIWAFQQIKSAAGTVRDMLVMFDQNRTTTLHQLLMDCNLMHAVTPHQAREKVTNYGKPKVKPNKKKPRKGVKRGECFYKDKCTRSDCYHSHPKDK